MASDGIAQRSSKATKLLAKQRVEHDEPELITLQVLTIARAGISPNCRPLAFRSAARNSGRWLRTRVSPDHLRRLSGDAQEGAAHTVAIGETRLPSDDVDRMAGLLHHQPGGLDPQVLDRLGRRLACLGAEGAAELARTEMSRFGELFNCQRRMEIPFRIG